jgi:hypothetical protein
VSYGPNDLEPCGSPTAVRRHIALSEWCPDCLTEGRRTRLPLLVELVEERRRYLTAFNADTCPDRNRRLRALTLVGSEVGA